MQRGGRRRSWRSALRKASQVWDRTVPHPTHSGGVGVPGSAVQGCTLAAYDEQRHDSSGGAMDERGNWRNVTK